MGYLGEVHGEGSHNTYRGSMWSLLSVLSLNPSLVGWAETWAGWQHQGHPHCSLPTLCLGYGQLELGATHTHALELDASLPCCPLPSSWPTCFAPHKAQSQLSLSLFLLDNPSLQFCMPPG